MSALLLTSIVAAMAKICGAITIGSALGELVSDSRCTVVGLELEAGLIQVKTNHVYVLYRSSQMELQNFFYIFQELENYVELRHYRAGSFPSVILGDNKGLDIAEIKGSIECFIGLTYTQKVLLEFSIYSFDFTMTLYL